MTKENKTIVKQTKLKKKATLIVTIIAFLLILSILYILFSLSLGTAPSGPINTCTSTPGFLCGNVVLNSNGTINFVFGEALGITMYNVKLACAATKTIQGYPNDNTQANGITSVPIWYDISNGGLGNTTSGMPSITTLGATTNMLEGFSDSKDISLINLPCAGQRGKFLGLQSAAGSFSGWIWINYTASPSLENPYVTIAASLVRIPVK